jgi:hypothetical protein
LEYGVGQIEDYTVIIRHRQVESIASGQWNNPAIWSCNCVPGGNDAVNINGGHSIQITPGMGLIECADLHLEPGAVLNLNGVMHVAGGCD